MIKFVGLLYNQCIKTFHFSLMVAYIFIYRYRKNRDEPAVWFFDKSWQGARMPAIVLPCSRAITQ